MPKTALKHELPLCPFDSDGDGNCMLCARNMFAHCSQQELREIMRDNFREVTMMMGQWSTGTRVDGWMVRALVRENQQLLKMIA